MASSSNSPCAACKFLRRKCTAECVFAPYFPPDQPHKFASVHKIFGASNITKLLNELPPHQREDAVNSLAYEADARVKDPVYGCVGAISMLQRQLVQLQQELAMAHSDIARLGGGGGGGRGMLTNPSPYGGPSSLLGGMQGMTLQSAPQHTLSSREQIMQAREHQMRVSRDVQLLELQRDTQLSREKLIEQLTRVGGGSLEQGLAAYAMSGSIAPLVQKFSSRSGSEGGSGSSGGGGSMS